MGNVPRFDTTSAALYGLLVLAQRGSCMARQKRRTIGQRHVCVRGCYTDLPPLLDRRDFSQENLALVRHGACGVETDELEGGSER